MPPVPRWKRRQCEMRLARAVTAAALANPNSVGAHHIVPDAESDSDEDMVVAASGSCVYANVAVRELSQSLCVITLLSS